MSPNQFRNLLAFLIMMRAEPFDLPAPSYIVEKFARYGTPSTLRDDDNWEAGLHPVYRAKVQAYLDHWSLHINEMEAQSEQATQR